MIHHSNCGMEPFTGDVIAGLLRHSLHTASHEQGQWKDTGDGPGSRAGEFIDWWTIANQGDSIVADVERIETHPLVPRHIPVHGYIYQVESGRLVEVPEATEVGRAR